VFSKTRPDCWDPSEALRSGSTDRLKADLVRYLVASAWRVSVDYRDVLVDLAPYFDCAQRLNIDPVALFDEAAMDFEDDVRELVRTFARRSDISLRAFGWQLVDAPDGSCYRPT
jgi:hypothetical protein